MIKYVYEIDYPLGQKRSYLEWVRSIADTLQAPGKLKRLASYDNVFSATPHRVIEFPFDSLEDAGKYYARKEVRRILQGELSSHGTNVHINVLTPACGLQQGHRGRRRTMKYPEGAGPYGRVSQGAGPTSTAAGSPLAGSSET